MPIEFGAGALDALVGALEAAEEIAAADHYRDLHAEIGGRLQIPGDAQKRGHVQAEAFRAGERLAGELDDDAAEQRRRAGVPIGVWGRRI